MAKLSVKQQQVCDHMASEAKTSPWVMRITERKNITGPVLVICERQKTDKGNTKLKEYGKIYNDTFNTCRAPIQYMLAQVTDEQGRPMNLDCLVEGRIAFRGNIPLNVAIGAKLALLFKLHSQVRDQKRIEMMAWRIECFTREETLYWLTKVTIPTYSKRSIDWAKSGLRVMLAGQPEDVKKKGKPESEVDRLLDQLRK